MWFLLLNFPTSISLLSITSCLVSSLSSVVQSLVARLLTRSSHVKFLITFWVQAMSHSSTPDSDTSSSVSEQFKPKCESAVSVLLLSSRLLPLVLSGMAGSLQRIPISPPIGSDLRSVPNLDELPPDVMVSPYLSKTGTSRNDRRLAKKMRTKCRK